MIKILHNNNTTRGLSLSMKRGGRVIFTDGTWTYDTEMIDAAITNSQRDWYERDMLNAFTRYTYY
ncbi:hypothetical protein [Lysinibacillus sp. CTST325]